MKKSNLIPFWLLPASWGLSGKSREVAKAEYELLGEELQRKLLEINFANLSEVEIGKRKLLLDYEYEHIGDEEFKRNLLELNPDGLSEKDKELALVDLDFEYGKLTEKEHKKKTATLKGEPFVDVVEIVTDPSDPSYGGVTLDWNDEFIKHLEENGFGPYPNPEQTVNDWFNMLCKNIAFEAFDGEGDFTERMDEIEHRVAATNVGDVISVRNREDSNEKE